MSYLALAIHELFHIFYAVKMKIPIGRLVVLPFGISMKIKGKLSHLNEILLCAMGPLGSFAVAVLGIYFSAIIKSNENIIYFIRANFSLFVINILPIYPLDGGRIFKRVLQEKLGIFKATQISMFISGLCVAIICVFIFVSVVAYRFNTSIVMLCAFLIYEISKQKNSAIKSYSELLIYSKEKLKESTLMPVREVVVAKNCPSKNILKMLSDSFYMVINIVDDRGKIIGRIGEAELIETIASKNRSNLICEVYDLIYNC